MPSLNLVRGDASPWKLIRLPSAALLTGGTIARAHSSAMYRTWKSVWQPVYEQVGRGPILHSDTFTRQGDRMGLFYGEECAAVWFMNPVDLSQEYFRDDSFFEYWPEITLKSLMQNGPRIVVGNGISVAPSFRKRDFGFSTKDLLMSLVIRHLLNGRYDAIAGNMRNSKGMNELAYFWGATPLLQNVEVHGEPSDLVGFFRDAVRPNADPEVAFLADELWENLGTNQERDESDEETPARRAGMR